MTSMTDSEKLSALSAPAEAVERYMADFLDQRAMPGNLREAIRYAALAPGKRLRPILVIRSAQAVGGTAQQAMAPAGAIELIHNFSLVHDDLPAMDDDDLRRGRPTLHKQTNEAMAILAGDAMTSLAFEMVLERMAPALAGKIAMELAAATTDMISGQVYDSLPDFAPEVSDIDRLRAIHRNKTGALIRCSCRMGAMAAGADDQQLAAITDYADAIGLMFQVVDDLLDVTQTTDHLGKAANKDAQAGKLTYPVVMGIDASREQVRCLQTRAHDALAPLGPAARPLRDLCDYMAVRSK